MKKLFEFIWRSSADPTKISLTVKSLLPLLSSLALLFGFHLPEGTLAEAMTSLVAILSATTAFCGALRKVYFATKNRSVV